jgi:hypothetical protein
MFYCKVCNKEIIGESKYGCMICKKIQMNKEFDYNKYFNALIGINLPIEIIKYISDIASITINYTFIRNINEKCWKSRMHNLIDKPHMLKKLFNNKFYIIN